MAASTVEEADAMADTSIDEVVGLLTDEDYGALEALRGKHPGQAALLRPGFVAGVGDPALRLRAEASLAAVRVVRPVCRRRAKAAADRLRVANRLELIGNVAAAAGSSSIVVGATSGTGTMVAAGLALVGAIAATGAQFHRKGLASSGDGTASHLTRLMDAYSDSFEVETGLEIALSERTGEADPGLVAGLIERANLLCRAVRDSEFEG